MPGTGVDLFPAYIFAMEKKNTTSSYDVSLSDMHFLITKWGKPEWEAGDRVIQEVKKRGLDIPVIIISSAQMRVDGAYAAIWYSDSRDWESELRGCRLRMLRRIVQKRK